MNKTRRSTEEWIQQHLNRKKGLVSLLTRRKRYEKEVLQSIDQLLDRHLKLEERVSKLEREKATKNSRQSKLT